MVWWCSTPHCSGHQVWRSCSSHVDPTCNEYPFPAETPLRFCTPSSAQAAEWCWLMMQMWRTVRVTIKSFREGGSISGMLLVCWVKVRGFLAVHRLVDFCKLPLQVDHRCGVVHGEKTREEKTEILKQLFGWQWRIVMQKVRAGCIVAQFQCTRITSTFENLREGVCAGLSESLAPCYF